MRILFAVPLLAALACGGEESECAQGATKCEGNVHMLCNVDTSSPGDLRFHWTVREDCTKNVDSGDTVCRPYDGRATCQSPK